MNALDCFVALVAPLVRAPSSSALVERRTTRPPAAPIATEIGVEARRGVLIRYRTRAATVVP